MLTRMFPIEDSPALHPKGTLMWDVGTVPDSAFKGDGEPVKDGISLAVSALKLISKDGCFQDTAGRR